MYDNDGYNYIILNKIPYPILQGMIHISPIYYN